MVHPPVRRTRTVVLVAAVGATLSIGAWAAAVGAGAARRDEVLDGHARQTAAAIEERVGSTIDLLYGVRAVFSSGSQPTRAQFRAAVVDSGMMAAYGSVRGISFVRLVPRHAVAAFGDRRAAVLARTRPPTRFAVHPSTAAPDAYIVDYIEPLAGNEAALGYDIGSNPERRAALEAARDEDLPVATPPVKLVQDGTDGLLLLLPVFRSAEPPLTTPQRRRDVIGFVSAVIPADAGLREVLGPASPVAVAITDLGPVTADRPPGDATGEQVFGSPGAGQGPVQLIDVNIGNRRWRLAVTPGERFQVGGTPPWLVLLLGAALTASLTALVGAQTTARGRAEALVATRTVELRETNERLVEADRLKTTFLGSVSHDLLTPLSAITGFTRLLETGTLDRDATEDALGRVGRNAQTLTRLIEDLLNVNRTERGGLELVMEPVSLAEVTRATVDQYQTVLARHRVRLELDRGIVVSADPHALERILANLLTNAAKFAPAGTAITVRVDADADDAVLTVADEGPGIPPDDLPHVFERYYRAAAGTSAPGSGVGLAVVAEFAQRMGGHAEASNRPGGGAQLQIRLPLVARDSGMPGPAAALEVR